MQYLGHAKLLSALTVPPRVLSLPACAPDNDPNEAGRRKGCHEHHASCDQRTVAVYPTAAGGDIYTDLALGEHTNSSYYAVHAIVPSGGGPPAHIHTREDEAFYVIRGELVFLLVTRS